MDPKVYFKAKVGNSFVKRVSHWSGDKYFDVDLTREEENAKYLEQKDIDKLIDFVGEEHLTIIKYKVNIERQSSDPTDDTVVDDSVAKELI